MVTNHRSRGYRRYSSNTVGHRQYLRLWKRSGQAERLAAAGELLSLDCPRRRLGQDVVLRHSIPVRTRGGGILWRWRRQLGGSGANSEENINDKIMLLPFLFI